MQHSTIITKKNESEQEWGPLAQFMFAREARAKCEVLAFRDEYAAPQGWIPYENFDRTSMDTIKSNAIEAELILSTEARRARRKFQRRIYTRKYCGKRSCYQCQVPRMRRWTERILERTESEGRRLWFVTATLPGAAHGREEWSSNLSSSYEQAKNAWHLSRVKVAVGRQRGKAFVASASDCVRVLEIPQNESGNWNPHYHVLTASDRSQSTVRRHWRELWQWGIDGSVVKPRIQVKPVQTQTELAEYVTKVTRYMTKVGPNSNDIESGNRKMDDVMFLKHNVSFCGSWRYANQAKQE